MTIGKTHLYLSVPGWKVSAFHAQCREHLMMECLRRGVDLTIDPELASGIDLARNLTVAKARAMGDVTVLGMIDGDVSFNKDSVFAILDALEQGLDIVGGLYPKKVIDYAAVGAAAKAGVPDAELKYHAGNMVGGAENGSRRMRTLGANRFVEADRLGTGFLFMRMEAIERFVAHHGWRTRHRSLWEPRGEQHTVFFSETQGPRQRARDALLKMALRHGRMTASIDELQSAVSKYCAAMSEGAELDVYQTEDFNFVYRAKEAGLGCWMYLDAELSHQGTWMFEGSIAKMLEQETKT